MDAHIQHVRGVAPRITWMHIYNLTTKLLSVPLILAQVHRVAREPFPGWWGSYKHVGFQVLTKVLGRLLLSPSSHVQFQFAQP